MFASEKAISRQEMFVLLYNTLKVIDEVPEGSGGKTLSAFTDSEEIAAWALDAMTYLVKAGIINGSDGSLLPESNTTRAEIAQVLYNLLAGTNK
jgi:hypothetical protein